MNYGVKAGLILEDNSIAQSYMEMALRESFADITIELADSLQAAFHLLDRFSPCIALVDMELPDGSGVEFLHRLAVDAPNCTPIVVTSHEDDETLYPALRAGAQGYLLKNQSQHKLVQYMQGVMRGEVALSPKITFKLMSYFSRQERIRVEGGIKCQQVDCLSRRETEVLSLIGRGLNGKQIAVEINVSYHTVTTHIKNIYTKLGITTRAEAAQQAILLGLVQ